MNRITFVHQYYWTSWLSPLPYLRFPLLRWDHSLLQLSYVPGSSWFTTSLHLLISWRKCTFRSISKYGLGMLHRKLRVGNWIRLVDLQIAYHDLLWQVASSLFNSSSSHLPFAHSSTNLFWTIQSHWSLSSPSSLPASSSILHPFGHHPMLCQESLVASATLAQSIYSLH